MKQKIYNIRTQTIYKQEIQNKHKKSQTNKQTTRKQIQKHK